MASAHLRGIVIASALAALALGLGLVTLAMNQTASKAAPPHVVLSLKARHKLAAAKTVPAVKPKAKAVAATPKAQVAEKAKVAAKPKPKPKANANVAAALKAGLPHSIAAALGKRPVVVVELLSSHDPVSELAAGEAKAGAALAGAGYVPVSVDVDGGAASTLTRVLGKLPTAPAALVYTRPGTVAVTLTGFNDRTAVQQAVANAQPQSCGAAAESTAAWAAQADTICSKYASEAQARGGAVQLVATNLPLLLSLYKQQQTELEALKAPKSAAGDLHVANAKLDQALAILAGTKKKSAVLVPATTFRGATALMNGASATYAKYGSTVCSSE